MSLKVFFLGITIIIIIIIIIIILCVGGLGGGGGELDCTYIFLACFRKKHLSHPIYLAIKTTTPSPSFLSSHFQTSLVKIITKV